MPRPRSDKTGNYEAYKSSQAELSRQKSEAGRDIGPMPPIANVRRREKTRGSLRLFCETYNPEAIYFSWSNDHLKALARIEEAATLGALYAFAMPRGSGKTTLCRLAILWAIAHAHVRYAYLIGANSQKAEDSIDAVKTFAMHLPKFVADFPEIGYLAVRLGNIVSRAAGQLSDGESTNITWSKDLVVMPTVKPPPNWPKKWKLRSDGMVPTAGAIISVSGLTGEGIRGSVKTLTTGEQVRPDLVLLDDPQTDDSSHSPSQNESREALIAGAVLGMAGPGRTISAVMPCTVISPGDMVDNLLDRKKHPMWRGERCRMLATMPTNREAWDLYYDVHNACAQKEPPDYTEANEYYLANRGTLDAGAVASWPERKLPGEVSAIQHAMNLFNRNRRAFMSEYQNDPMPPGDGAIEVVTADFIANKFNRHDRRLVPLPCTRLTAGIDVQKSALFWTVTAWEDDFTGAVIDYGCWPDPKRNYFTLADIKVTLQDATKTQGLEGAIFAGLGFLCAELLGRRHNRDDGAGLQIERCLIDANWGPTTDTVYKFCRESAYAGVLMPSHGKFVGPGSQQFAEYKKKPGERIGYNWRIPNVQGKRQVRHVLFDTNGWKSFLYARLAVPTGDRGAMTLFGDRPELHRLLADHLTAENLDKQTSEKTERRIDVWTLKPGRPDNHWLDALVMACVAGSIQGVTLRDIQPGGGGKPVSHKRVSFAEQQRLAQGKRR